MSVIANFYALDIKHTQDSDKALKSRGEMGLSNLTVGSSTIPLETFNKDCYNIVLDKDRKKAYILVRINTVDESDLYNFASEVPDVYANNSIGLL